MTKRLSENRHFRACAESPKKELLALIDSRGCLGIAGNCGSATHTSGGDIGTRVTVRRAHLLE